MIKSSHSVIKCLTILTALLRIHIIELGSWVNDRHHIIELGRGVKGCLHITNDLLQRIGSALVWHSEGCTLEADSVLQVL